MVGPVSIESTRFERTMDAEVSKKVLIDLTAGKKNVLDNVAPGPRTWEIEGYVGGLPGELSSLYMPSIPVAAAALDFMSQARQIVVLRDKLFKTYDVLIARLWIADQPDTQNRMPVRITLVEITSLTTSVATLPTQAAASPAAGSALGAPQDAGLTETIAAPYTPPGG
jgi:hypothetical protein